MTYTSRAGYEEQYNILLRCRHAIVDKGMTMSSFSEEVGVPYHSLRDWSKAHCVDVYRSNPYTKRMMKWLLIYRYGPFVKNAELCPAIGYSQKNMHVVRWHLDAVLLSVSPWSGRMPRIIFRDIMEISEMIKSCESVYLVAEEAGYPASDLRHLFDLGTQRKISAKLKEVQARNTRYHNKRKLNKQEVRHAHSN